MRPFNYPDKFCCVYGCKSSGFGKEGGAQLHPFPPKGILLDGRELIYKWLEAIKLPGRVSRRMKVCSLHFSPNDYQTEGDTKKLKSLAVPSCNLPLVRRNKFSPRDYGKLLKLLEYRGIGRLRLSFESKLSRKIKGNRIDLISGRRKLLSKKPDEEPSNNKTQDMGLDDPLSPEDLMSYDPKDPQLKYRDFGDSLMDENEPDFICNICGEEDCGGHEELELFECFPCGKVFRTSRQLNAHNLCHFEYKNRGGLEGGERVAICKVCNKVLPSSVRVTEHMQVHSGEKPHVCLLCDKSFRHKVNLVQHVNSHTVKETFKCKVCKVVFQFVEELDAHVRTHKIVKKEYACRECGLKFRSKTSCWSHLNSHIRNRSKPGLECSLCGRILSTKATLKEHMFIHSGEKPFECLLCGKKIRHRANFIIHVQGHSLGQPHCCVLCRMSFARKSELNTHMLVEHPEERPFHCIVCNLRFRSEARFVKHAITHDAYLEEES